MKCRLLNIHVVNLLKMGGLRMLWSIIVLLIILWLLGFSFEIGGGLVHILLVIALVVLIVRLLTGGRAP